MVIVRNVVKASIWGLFFVDGGKTMGTAPVLGQTVQSSTGDFYFSYQVDLGQVVIMILLLCILVVLIMRWLGDWIYRR